MKTTISKLLMACCLLMSSSAYAQMPPRSAYLGCHKVTLRTTKSQPTDIYAIIPTTAETETTKGIPAGNHRRLHQ
jgi:hypothetical protein